MTRMFEFQFSFRMKEEEKGEEEKKIGKKDSGWLSHSRAKLLSMLTQFYRLKLATLPPSPWTELFRSVIFNFYIRLPSISFLLNAHTKHAYPTRKPSLFSPVYFLQNHCSIFSPFLLLPFLIYPLVLFYFTADKANRNLSMILNSSCRHVLQKRGIFRLYTYLVLFTLDLFPSSCLETLSRSGKESEQIGG